MEELVQGQVLFEIGAVGELSTKAALEVVKLFHGRNATNAQVNLALICLRAEYLIEVSAERCICKLRFKIALTIESGCLDERLRFLVLDLEENTVGRDLLTIKNFDDIADFHISESGQFPLNLTASIGVERAVWLCHT